MTQTDVNQTDVTKPAYASPADEHVNVRTNVGMQDLSSMGEVDIKGPGAERLINRLLVNEIADLEPGQVRYSTMCNEDGGIVDDLTVYKFSDEHFMIVTSSAPRKRAVRWIVEHEQAPRGWYTGPIGWIDTAGDATVRVAIRCGVVEPGVAHAHVFVDSTRRGGFLNETELVPKTIGPLAAALDVPFALRLARAGKVPNPLRPHKAKNNDEVKRLWKLLEAQAREQQGLGTNHPSLIDSHD